MNYRDYLQALIYKVIDPLIRGMIKIRMTPNIVTTIGFILNVVSAIIFIYAGTQSYEDMFFYVGLGGGLLLFASLFDMLDGRLARVGNMSTEFGAFYDSVLDRYSELLTLFGIVFLFIEQGYFWSSIVTFIALIGSIMVSYVRARAEGLDIECKVGLMQRPERVVLTSCGSLFCGLFCNIELFDPMLILIIPIWIIAILANYTAFVRISHCYKEFNKRKG